MATVEPSDLIAAVAEQVHTTAWIAEVKHRHVRRAIGAAVAAVPVGLSLYVLSLQVG